MGHLLVEWGVMGELLVEVVPATGPEGGQDLTARLPERFQARAAEIAGGIAEVARRMGPQFADLLKDDGSPWSVDQLQMSFGVAAQADANIVVVTAHGQATFTVTVTWSRKE